MCPLTNCTVSHSSLEEIMAMLAQRYQLWLTELSNQLALYKTPRHKLAKDIFSLTYYANSTASHRWFLA